MGLEPHLLFMLLLTVGDLFVFLTPYSPSLGLIHAHFKFIVDAWWVPSEGPGLVVLRVGGAGKTSLSRPFHGVFTPKFIRVREETIILAVYTCTSATLQFSSFLSLYPATGHPCFCSVFLLRLSSRNPD
jgi:hypothetical protein